MRIYFRELQAPASPNIAVFHDLNVAKVITLIDRKIEPATVTIHHYVHNTKGRHQESMWNLTLHIIIRILAECYWPKQRLRELLCQSSSFLPYPCQLHTQNFWCRTSLVRSGARVASVSMIKAARTMLTHAPWYSS